MKIEVKNATSHSLRGEGDNRVFGKDMPKFVNGKVRINSDQYFEDVPEDVWNFRIGNHFPARDWLKDRKGMKIKYTDTLHYERIVNILSETQRIMETIEIDLPSG